MVKPFVLTLLVSTIAIRPAHAAGNEDACFEAVGGILPTVIKSDSLDKTVERLRDWACDESQQARSQRKASGLKLDVVGIGLLDFSDDSARMEERRRKVCTDKRKFIDRFTVLQTLQVDDARKVQALEICQQGKSTEAIDVSYERVNADTLLVHLKRRVAGQNEIQSIVPVVSTCTAPKLPVTLKASETFSFPCKYDPTRGAGALVRTSIGTFTVSLPPTETFTARIPKTEIVSEPIGYTTQRCQRTCNAHNRPPCTTTIKLKNAEPNIKLGPPYASWCTQPKLGRCKYYSQSHAPVFAADGQSVIQEWTMRSRPTRVCMRVMRFRSRSILKVEEEKIQIGPTAATLKEGTTELVDSKGITYRPGDDRFIVKGQTIRLRY